MREQSDVGEDGRIERTRRVQLEEVKTRRAEVDALHRPVAKARNAKGTAIADALGEDAPRVGKVVTVIPHRPEYFEVVIRLRPADPVRDEAHPETWPEHAPSLGRGIPAPVRTLWDAMDIAELRHEKDHYFGHAHDSPLTVDQRAHFDGLRYFPDDDAFRFTVTVDPEGSGAVEEVEMSDGSTDHLPRAGTVRFDVGGERVGLIAFAQGDGLFIPFRDATSGKETYGAGRYVEAEPLGDGRFELDFNRAYNPYCAYNDAWRCPLPPRENWLTVPIRAGEMSFH